MASSRMRFFPSDRIPHQGWNADQQPYPRYGLSLIHIFLEEHVVKRCAPILVLATIFLGGCLWGPGNPKPVVQAPAMFRGQSTADSFSLADQKWWNIYSDPLLEALIKEALKNNYDLRTAIARTQEARAYVGVARSAYYPSVGYNSGAQRDRGVYKSTPSLDPVSYTHLDVYKRQAKPRLHKSQISY